MGCRARTRTRAQSLATVLVLVIEATRSVVHAPTDYERRFAEHEHEYEHGYGYGYGYGEIDTVYDRARLSRGTAFPGITR